ncbi:hypothetical protein PHJA_002217600 [Phtheirospermum japonicum]|uniref:AT-hook motif nuclear-localized protein n=1 Tax=Phtheirospermum japonicum TaxID=374723 RepID=A0A830CN37_9LAMI|nr:hypothetical protein PHJA_002217600 [Phtheirospermum japonicum]
MAARGNSSVDQRPVILALECPRLEQTRGSSRRRSRPRARRVPNVHFAAVADLFCPCILTVHTGEDIGETIRAFFEVNKHNVHSRSKCMSVEGRIFTILGDVSNPRLKVQGLTTNFKGTYSIVTLTGQYIICRDGTVQQDHLKLSFQPGDRVVGGSVVGPLISGCAVQIKFSCYYLVQ